MAEEKEAKVRPPEEADEYWNWQPGSLIVNKWPDGWEEIPLDDLDDDDDDDETDNS